MSFGVLRAAQQDNELKDSLLAAAKYELFDNFYEHRFNRAGADYKESELEAFVARHGDDPFNVEGSNLEEWSIKLAQLTSDNEVLVIALPYKK